MRFWLNVRKADGDGCWIWTGYRDRAGYGYVSTVGKKSARAHRVAYKLEYGPVPAGFFVLHRCDNPACVRPSHLQVGTHEENMQQMRARRRSNRGERNGAAKLTDKDVRVVRQLSKCGVPRREIGALFNLHPATVGQIARRERWNHVP